MISTDLDNRTIGKGFSLNDRTTTTFLTFARERLFLSLSKPYLNSVFDKSTKALVPRFPPTDSRPLAASARIFFVRSRFFSFPPLRTELSKKMAKIFLLLRFIWKFENKYDARHSRKD